MYIDSVGGPKFEPPTLTNQIPPQPRPRLETWSTDNEKLVLSATVRVRRHFPGESDDLLQEARVAVLSAYDDFKAAAGASFRTFACHKIRGAVTAFLRRKRRHDCCVSLFDEVAIGTTTEKCQLIDKVVGDYPPDDRELAADVAAAMPLLSRLLQSLPRKHATVIKALYFEQASLYEIATKLKCTKQRICALRSDALRRLRVQLRIAIRFPLADQEPLPTAN